MPSPTTAANAPLSVTAALQWLKSHPGNSRAAAAASTEVGTHHRFSAYFTLAEELHLKKRQSIMNVARFIQAQVAALQAPKDPILHRRHFQNLYRALARHLAKAKAADR